MPAGLAVLAGAVLVATPAKMAAFEGVIGMRLALEGGTGRMELSLSGGNARLDLTAAMESVPEPKMLAFLHRAGSPRSVLMLDAKRKLWSEADLPAIGGPAEGAQGRYRVKTLGRGEVLGRRCVHVSLARDGEFVDAWIAEDLRDAFSALRTLQEANPQVGEPGLFRALEAAGHAGLPMRLTVIREGQRVTTEVTSVERKELPASLFAIPQGWRRMDSAAPAVPAARKPAAKAPVPR